MWYELYFFGTVEHERLTVFMASLTDISNDITAKDKKKSPLDNVIPK